MPKNEREQKKKHMRPALTPEARENQLISLATDLAEEQMREGTASSQVLTHFLKLGTIKQKLELEMMEKQKELISAKADNLKSAKKIEALYTEALEAMRLYSGGGTKPNDYEEEE